MQIWILVNTSGINITNHGVINETIENLKQENVTIIIIAHRISTLENCNRIYEINNGSLTGEYRYEDLVKGVPNPNES